MTAGAGATTLMTSVWQLVLLWGVVVGLATGSMAMSLVATVVGRWLVARRGLVSGLLTGLSLAIRRTPTPVPGGVPAPSA